MVELNLEEHVQRIVAETGQPSESYADERDAAIAAVQAAE